MRKTLQQFIKLLLLAIVLVSGDAWGQTTSVNSVLLNETFGTTYGNSTAGAPFVQGLAVSGYPKDGTTTFVAADNANITFSADDTNAKSFNSNQGGTTAGHIWMNTSTTGWFQISGIPLYNASKIKVAFTQTSTIQTTVAVAFDGSTSFSNAGTTSTNGTNTVSNISVSGHTSISLKFTRANSSGNVRYDNIVVTVTEIASGPGIAAGNSNILSGALTATYGTASTTPRTIAVSGSVLTANITATAATNFEVSSDGTTWSDTATFTQTSGSASGTLSVRLKNTAPVNASYNNITAATLTSTGATNVLVKTTTTSNSVTAKALTITGLTGNNKVYDTYTTATFSGTPTYSGLVNGETFTVSGTPTATFANANIGTGKTITVSGFTVPSTNYSLTQPSLTGNITAATPTVTATGTTSYTYTANTPQGPAGASNTGTGTSYTYSYSGTDNGGTAYGPTANKPTNAGSYQLIATVAANGNYSAASSSPLSFSINKAPSTVAVTGGYTFVFAAGTPQGPSGSNTTGSTGAVTFLYTSTDGGGYSSTALPTAVGSYQAIATLAADNNYNGATSSAFAFNITSVALPAISGAATASATYGVAMTAYTLTITENPTTVNATGLPAGLSLSQVSPYQITGTPSSAPGTYTVTATATNQGGTGDPFTFTITIAAKTLTIAGASVEDKTYDGTNTATLNGTLSGVVVGDEALVTLNKTATFVTLNAGLGITVNSTSTLSGTKATYYTLTQPTGLTANINKATPIVTATGTTAYTYIESTPQGPASATNSGTGTSYTYSYSGTENSGAAYGPTTNKPTNAGSYQVIATVATTTNYAVASSTPLAFTIAKANQALTLSNLTKTTTDAAFTLATTTTAGAQAVTYNIPDNAVATISGNTVTITGVGVKTITATAPQTNNYNDFTSSFTLTVTLAATAPTAIAATNIAGTSFTANWNSLMGASSYILDVYTIGTSQAATATELFNFAASGSQPSIPTGWTQTDICSANDYLKMTKSTAALTSLTVDATNYSTLRLNAQIATFGSPTLEQRTITIYISVDGGAYQNVTTRSRSSNGSSYETMTEVDLDAYAGHQVQIKIQTLNASGTCGTTDAGARLKNIVLSGKQNVPVNVPVSGYNSLNVGNTTSYNVTGLTANTTYYYTVKGVNGSSTTALSNLITVPSGPASTTWNGTVWSNGLPNITINAIIQAPYTQDLSFEAANLTVNSPLTIKTGKTVTVHNALVSNSSITVENNAALVLKEGATQSGTGISNTTVTRLGNPLFRLDYTMWGSPVTGTQTLLQFSPYTATSPNRFYIYGYNETQELYLNVPSPQTTTFAKGKSYLIRMPNNLPEIEGYNIGNTQLAFTGTFNGTPNNGDIDVKIIDADAGTNFNGHYIAVSNPYPSPISVKAFFDANEDVLDAATTMYFWRKKNDATTSSYAKLNLNGYVKNTGSTLGGDIDGGGASYYPTGTENILNWVLSPGQGFLVKLKTNLTATQYVKFRNSMRRSVTLITDANNNPNQPFFKTQNNNEEPAESRWWMNLTGTGDAFSQTLVGYLPQATLGVDFALDGRSYNDGNTRLYSSQQGEGFGIQARPSFIDTDVVTMGYTVSAAGQYTLSLDRVEGVFAQGQAIYIKDNLLGTVTNISEAGTYTFTTATGTFETRFEVIYQPQGQLGTQNPELENLVMVYQNNGAINITTGNVEMQGVTLYDIRGRKLYEQNGINATQTAITGLNAAHQVIIVEINTVNGTVSKKIVY